MYFQLGFPGRKTFQQTPEDMKRAKKLVNMFNGITPVFRTLYNFTGIPDRRNAVVDKIFFDFDVSGGQELTDLRKLHEYLSEEKLSHRVFFSGNGFHLFLKAKPIYAQATPMIRAGIKGAHRYFSDNSQIKPDPATKDIMRFARLPNTINIKTGLYCIPLDYSEIYLEREEIEKLAINSRRLEVSETGKPIDISEYFHGDMLEVEYLSADGLDTFGTELSDELPKCVKYALKEGNCGYDQRYAIITALRDLAYSKEDTVAILKKYLDKNKFEHCIYEEDQVTYLYEKHPEYIFPSCETLREEYCMCVEGCSGQKIYIEDLL